LEGRTYEAAGVSLAAAESVVERLFGCGAELCLFERPVFHVEQVGVVERLIAPGRFGIGDGLDRSLGQVGGYWQGQIPTPRPLDRLRGSRGRGHRSASSAL